LEVAVGSEHFVHGMKDLCKELDRRIARLEKFRDILKKKIDGDIAVKKNSKELTRVVVSLCHAKTARKAMEDSCCIYSCEFRVADR